jgi:predicted GIY-YIG superfamily endonuclease
MQNIYTVYRATNQINGKCYIGMTNNLDKRKKEHFGNAFR